MHQGGFKRAALAAVLALPVAFAAPAARAAVVYDNINPQSGFYQPMTSTDEIGDDVTLAPGGRQVTQFSVLVYNNLDGPYTADFTANFYLPDENGLPGESLWQGVVHVADGQTGDRLISWDVPGVTVPDSFIWGLSIVANGTDDIGPYLNDVPAPGASADVAYFNDGTGWFDYNYHPDFPDLANVSARIVTADASVPEPTTAAWLVAAGAGALSARRRRPAR